MYKESKKEKFLRFALIAGIAIVTLYLFSIQFAPDLESGKTEKQETVVQMAAVIQELDDKNPSPIVVMVKEHEGEPIIVKYKINPEDDYRFETLHALELSSIPTGLQADKETGGVWVQLHGSWTYFNNELEMEKGKAREKVMDETDYSFVIEETDTLQYLLKISNDSGSIIQKSFAEEPLSVIRLSKGEDLWLVVFEEDTILLVP